MDLLPPLNTHGIADLERARRLLASRSLAVRLTEVLGKPIEMGLEALPAAASAMIHKATRVALEQALHLALRTLGSEGRPESSDRMHRWATGVTGAAGGLFGLGSVVIELPITTGIMLRSIGDIARSEGHDLAHPETRLACLEVFALGGSGSRGDASETGYYAVRAALAQAVSDALRHVARRGMTAEGAPVLIRLIEKIAARFGVIVQEKVALEALPVIGAVSGAAINTVFTEHFQNLARGHFIIRRLELQHGAEAVRTSFERLTGC